MAGVLSLRVGVVIPCDYYSVLLRQNFLLCTEARHHGVSRTGSSQSGKEYCSIFTSLASASFGL